MHDQDPPKPNDSEQTDPIETNALEGISDSPFGHPDHDENDASVADDSANNAPDSHTSTETDAGNSSTDAESPDETSDETDTETYDEDHYDHYEDHDHHYYHESPFTYDLMPRVTIPPSHLEHGKLGVGGWVFGNDTLCAQPGNMANGSTDHHASEQHSRSVMEAAIRRGMNHFDTADTFGGGASEMLIAKFLEADYHRREGIFLATQTTLHEPDPEAVIERLNASLDRLETYWIDLYTINWPRSNVDMRPVFAALESARTEGKIKCIGVSHFTVEQMDQVREVCDLNACQLTYNLLWRQAEKELLPYCREHKLSVVTTSSLAQGILTGKFNEQPQFAAGDIRPTTVPFEKQHWPHVHEAVKQFEHVAREASRPLAHLALRWIARNPDVTSMLVGARNAIQLNILAGAMAGDIEDALLDQLTPVSDELQQRWPAGENLFRFHP